MPSANCLGSAFSAAESNAQITRRVPGVESNLYIRVNTNDRGTSTLRFRINGGDGNQVVSITASTTGEFEDTSNTDTIAAGDLTDYQITGGAGGTTLTFGIVSTLF